MTYRYRNFEVALIITTPALGKFFSRPYISIPELSIENVKIHRTQSFLIPQTLQQPKIYITRETHSIRFMAFTAAHESNSFESFGLPFEEHGNGVLPQDCGAYYN